MEHKIEIIDEPLDWNDPGSFNKYKELFEKAIELMKKQKS